MRLELGVYPDFYKQYKWVAEEEENSVYFTGRKNYLENFWQNMYRLVSNTSRSNRTFIGQRKLGKTSYLVRCYNVSFWEQQEVIPFYYCFPQEDKMDLRTIAKEIASLFLKQAVAFITKNKKLFQTKSDNSLLSKLKKQNFEWFEELEIYWQECLDEIQNAKGDQIIKAAWNLVDCFSGLFDKKCLLIVDEYQKTLDDLLEKDKPIRCHESLSRVVKNFSILTIISGSQISMLAKQVLTSEFRNRIPGETFYPLRKNEAHELILRLAGDKGYKGIAKDIYKYVGGNPYYIQMFFKSTNLFHEHHGQHKKWQCLKDIEETYNFEMLHRNGTVFQFWEAHLQEKHRLLNNDPKKHKGLTLRILKFIAEKEEKTTITEIENAFPELQDIRAKMRQLEKADLISYSDHSRDILNFSDAILPVVITKMYQKEILGDTKKETFEKDRRRWIKLYESRLSDVEIKVKTTQEKLISVEQYFSNIKAKKKSKKGKISLGKGIKAEGKFRKNFTKLLKSKNSIFSNYQLVNPMCNIVIQLASGRGRNIDVYGVLESLNEVKPKKYAVIGEVKEHSRKIGESQIQKFIDGIGLAKTEFKHKNVIGIFVSKSGFTKGAVALLQKHDVVHGDGKEVLNKLSN